jgi:small GTP-binding protein
MKRGSFDPDFMLKIILLGDTGVGKTSLANSWLFDHFDSSFRPTVGASNAFKDIEINRRKETLSVWDTAGQEKFRSITPLYVRGARCAIVVVAANSTESFGSIPEWLNMLSSSQQEPISAILAVNKVDLVDDSDENVSTLIELYRKRFAAVFSVSALNGLNVDSLFREAGSVAVASRSVTTTMERIVTQDEPAGCC